MVGPRLSVVEQQRLADALFDCECIRDRRVRDQLLQTLRQESAGKYVNVVRQDNDRADVIGILNAFARHPGGLISLLACIDLFEPGAAATHRLRALVERVEPDPLLSGDERADLEGLLELISCPEAETLYWESVGAFGPPPTGIGRDLVSLARDLTDVVGGPLPPLLIFLELVASRSAGHRHALHEWIDSHAVLWDIDPNEIFRHRLGLGSREVSSTQSYLVVLLDPYGADPQRYLPSAWFHGSGLSKKLRLDDEPIAYEDLAEVLDNLLTHDAEVTRDAASRLVVEVFLPRNLINREIDQLQIAPAGFARPIGTQHPVVVRPIERLRSPAMHREWRRKWEWLRKHGADRRATAVGIHAITEPVAIEPRQLLVQLMGDSTPVGIIMAFPPAESDSLGSDEYAAGVHSGAPLMIWCRDQRPAVEFLDEIQGLLAGHGLLMIPELISRYRQRAHYPEAEHQHLGRHLTLLWDDFDRKPDEESGSLSAPARGPK